MVISDKSRSQSGSGRRSAEAPRRPPASSSHEVARAKGSVADKVKTRVLTDRHYRITTGPRAGEVRRIFAPAGRRRAPGAQCYEVFEGRTYPCAGCPAFASGLGSSERSGVLEGGSPAVMRLVTVRPVGPREVDVAVRCIPRDALPELLGAHLSAWASEARLSPKELRVLELLVIGRRPREIAVALAISERTAKFHQENVLAKLGADSRLDLVRVLLLPAADR